MHGPIYKELTPVRQRQQRLSALRLAVGGLLAGSLVGIGLGLGKWLAGWTIAPWLAAAVLLAGPVLGAALGWLRRRSWEEAAGAVDAHFELKDRVVTALQFMTNPDPTGYHEMQVRDAVHALRGVEPCQAVPLWLPRSWPLALGLFGVAAVLLAWPLGSQPAAAAPEALQAILDEADVIDESLDRLEDLALLDQNQELARLVAELRQKVEEMRQPGVDLRQALAKISEMQAAIQSEIAQYSVPLVDAHLKELGTALSAAGSLQDAGKALQDGQLDKAAQELDKVEEPPADRKEAKSLEDKLHKTAKNLREAKLDRLSKATSKMASGVRGDKSQYKKGAGDLAKEVRNHERRRRINQLLAFEQERLTECKSLAAAETPGAESATAATGRRLGSGQEGPGREDQPAGAAEAGPGAGAGRHRAQRDGNGKRDPRPAGSDAGVPGVLLEVSANVGDSPGERADPAATAAGHSQVLRADSAAAGGRR
jgi:hypothetical protein